MLKHLSLPAKLSIVYAAYSIPVLSALMFAGASARRTDSALTRLIAVDERAQADAASIAYWTLQCRRYEKDMFLNSADPQTFGTYEQEWIEAIENLRRCTASLVDHVEDGAIRTQANRFEDMRQIYEVAVRDVVSRIHSASDLSPADANAAMTPHKGTIRGLSDLSFELVSNLEERAAAAQSQVAKEARATDRTMGATALAVGVLGLVATLIIPRLLSSRLGRVVAFTEGLRSGGRSARCALTGADEAGRIAAALNNMLDDLDRSVTRELEANAAQLEAQRLGEMKTIFLANMSHEIRTPLTAILGFTDILLEEERLALTPDQRTETVLTIRNAGRHLLAVINDILDLSKIEADRMIVEKIETPLTTLLLEIESLLRSRAAAQNITLRVALATPVPDRVMSDPTRLRQILMNLAGNAIKFTEKGSVTLTAGMADLHGQSRLVIDVEDTGVGMSEAQAERVFDAFSQADVSVTRKHGGTGLGLAISRRLANLMAGDVKLLRTELGKGSCFRIVLPIEAAAGSAMVTNLRSVKPTRPSQTPGHAIALHGHILLVEDSPDNQRLISFHLRKAGAQVTIADNGRKALELIEHAVAEGRPFDILLTDMQMPEMDGYTLARTLRQRGNTMAIVALTANAMAEDRAKCREAGCDEYSSKPIDKDALLAICASWMGQTGGTRMSADAA